jgi:hypothetical protein
MDALHLLHASLTDLALRSSRPRIDSSTRVR